MIAIHAMILPPQDLLKVVNMIDLSPTLALSWFIGTSSGLAQASSVGYEISLSLLLLGMLSSTWVSLGFSALSTPMRVYSLIFHFRQEQQPPRSESSSPPLSRRDCHRERPFEPSHGVRCVDPLPRCGFGGSGIGVATGYGMLIGKLRDETAQFQTFPEERSERRIHAIRETNAF